MALPTIPDDLLVRMLSYHALNFLSQSALVCSSWKQISNARWKDVLQQQAPEKCLRYKEEAIAVDKVYYSQLTATEILFFISVKMNDLKLLAQMMLHHPSVAWNTLQQTDGKTLIHCAMDRGHQTVLSYLYAQAIFIQIGPDQKTIKYRGEDVSLLEWQTICNQVDFVTVWIQYAKDLSDLL